MTWQEELNQTNREAADEIALSDGPMDEDEAELLAIELAVHNNLYYTGSGLVK